jgi:lipopolysaccharide transport system ATP-binding protein
MSDFAVQVSGLSKCYHIYRRPQDRLRQSLWAGRRKYYREFWALRDVTLAAPRGATIGIIGRNGSGKSTLLQLIAGTLTPTAGTVATRGRVAALLELGSGFNPEFTGRENVFVNGAILGLPRREMDARLDEIAAFADIGEFIEQPVKTFSSGMVVRLAFAVAACVQPDVLLVDEALAVGDLMFQARCLERIRQLRESGVTTLFVTHDMGTFQTLCDHGYLLDHGRVFAEGEPARVALRYYDLVREAEHARQRLAGVPAAEGEAVRRDLAAREAAIRDKPAEGEYRFGTQAATIVGFDVRNRDGAATESLRTGEPFSVAVRVRIAERVEHLTVGVMFRNAQGQNLMGMHSYHENRIVFGVHEPGETLEIVCAQTLLLNPGEYLMQLSVADHRSDHDFTVLDSRNNLARIHVFGPEVAYGLVHTQPAFTWRVLPAGEGRTP